MRRRLLIGLLTTAVAAAPALAAQAKGSDPDGRYEGRYTDGNASRWGEIKLRIRHDGRKIVRFRAVTTAVCVNPNAIGGIEVVPVAATFDRIGVNRRGRFSKKIRQIDPDSDYKQTYRVSGRLKRSRIKGGNLRLEGRCAADRPFQAKRKH